MYDIDRCTVLGVQIFFFQRLHARKWNNFTNVLVLVVLVFVFNKYIGNLLPDAGLLRDLTLEVSHDNYRKEILIHVELRLEFQLFLTGLKFRGLSFRGLRSEVWSFEVWVLEVWGLMFRGLRSEVWGLKFRGLSFRDTRIVRQFPEQLFIRSRVLQCIAARSNFQFDMMSKVKVNVNTLVWLMNTII